MAKYAIEFRRSAQKDLDRLDARTGERVLHAIAELGDEPRPPGCGKLKGGSNAYRIRVGDYRVIYSVKDAVLVVAIERVRHRREVYR